MPFVTPRTWVAGDVLTAAQLNQDIRDNIGAIAPIGAGAWTAYTPTLTQGVTVTKTVTYAAYMKVGRLIAVNVALAVTGAGTAANAVAIGLPVAAASGLVVPIGSGWVFDTSVADTITGVAYLASTTVAQLVSARSPGSIVGTGGGFAAALAAGDTVLFSATYESAT